MPIERLKYETIHLKDGRNAVLSTARLPSGEYETMLLGQDGDEIVSAKSPARKRPWQPSGISRWYIRPRF